MKRNIFFSLCVLALSTPVLAQQVTFNGPLTIDSDTEYTVQGGSDGYIFGGTNPGADNYLHVTNDATFTIHGKFFNQSYMQIDEGSTVIAAGQFAGTTSQNLQVDGHFYVNDSIDYGAPYKWSTWLDGPMVIGENGYFYSRYGIGNFDTPIDWTIRGVMNTDIIGLFYNEANHGSLLIDGGTLVVRHEVDPETAYYTSSFEHSGTDFRLINNGKAYIGYAWTDTNGDFKVTEDELTANMSAGGFYNRKADNAWAEYTQPSNATVVSGLLDVSTGVYNGIDIIDDSKPGYLYVGTNTPDIATLKANTYYQEQANSVLDVDNNGIVQIADSVDFQGGQLIVQTGGTLTAGGLLSFEDTTADLSGTVSVDSSSFNTGSVIDINSTLSTTSSTLNAGSTVRVIGDLSSDTLLLNTGALLQVSGNLTSSVMTTLDTGSILQIDFGNPTTPYGQIQAQDMTFNPGATLYLNSESPAQLNPDFEVQLIDTDTVINDIANLNLDWSAHFDQLVLYTPSISLSPDNTDVVLSFTKAANADEAAIRFEGVSLLVNSFQSTAMKVINSRLATQRMAEAKEKRYEFASLYYDSFFPFAQEERSNLWVQTFSLSGDYDGDATRNLTAYDSLISGISMGYDYRIGNTRFGGAFHYAGGTIEGDANLFEVDTENMQANFYTSTDFADFYFNTSVGYGIGAYDQKRLDSGSVYSSDYDSEQYSIGIQFGRAFSAGNWLLNPYVGFDYSEMTIDSYQESSGLIVEEQNQKFVLSKFGGTAHYQFELMGGNVIAPYVTFEMGYDSGDHETVKLLDGNGLISVGYNSPDLGQVVQRAGAGLAFMTTNRWMWNMEYEYETRDKYQSHMGLLKGRVLF